MADPRSYEELVAEAEADVRTLVRVARAGAVATVTLDDPAKYNVLSAPLTVQLRRHLQTLVVDRGVRVIVLTGSDPAFSAGGDVRLMTKAAGVLDTEDGAVGLWRWIRREFGGIARLIAQSDTTFIAAVNGAAAGVGLAFAYASDLIIASSEHDWCPRSATSDRAGGRDELLPHAPRRPPARVRALRLRARGERRRGGRDGLVNHVVPHERLLDEARAWVDRIVGVPDAIEPAKPPCRAADATWEQAIAMEEFAEPMWLTTAGHKAAVRRFMDRRG